MTPAACREFLHRRETRRQQALDARFAEAWQGFHQIVRMIRADYDPVAVYQWGSLLNRRRFLEFSDIDIAIEGIREPATFFELYGKADRLTSLPLDLVALEQIEPEFADIIRSRGVKVYERRS
jgi:predicted nucleotidyltransferase